MEEELLFIQNDRENNANFHLLLAQQWRRFGETNLFHNPLVYSALEYRLSIERIVFELYALMRQLKFVSDDEAKKLEKLKSVVDQIMEIVGNSKYLYRILLFHSLLFDDDSKVFGKLAVPDVSRLKKYWHALSDYCHMKINPENSWQSKDYVKEGYKLLNDVEEYLWDIKISKHFGFYRMDTWQPEVITLAEDFVNSKIDENAVKTRLMLMKPIILSRYKK